MSQKQSFIDHLGIAISILEGEISDGKVKGFELQLIELKKAKSIYTAAYPATEEPAAETPATEEPAAEEPATNLQNSTLADFTGPIND